MTNLEEAMDKATDVDGLVAKLAAYQAVLVRGADRKAAFNQLIALEQRRYLFLSRGSVPLLDGKHFFAAMYQELTGEMVNVLERGADHRGYTLLLGIGNELKQCLDEARARDFNSCFSPEDLGTNRLGYLFARRVIKARLTGTSVSMQAMLRTFLEERGPVSIARVHASKGPGVVHTAFELGKVPVLFHQRVVQALWNWIVPLAH